MGLFPGALLMHLFESTYAFDLFITSALETSVEQKSINCPQNIIKDEMGETTTIFPKSFLIFSQ